MKKEYYNSSQVARIACEAEFSLLVSLVLRRMGILSRMGILKQEGTRASEASAIRPSAPL